MPAKLAPKQFKPIPDGAPAKELGEYLRAMIRAADVTLDRVAAAGGMAKNTLTTTMDGRSKGWPSIQEWLKAYSKAVGAPPYARQIDDIQRLFQRGQQNHRNALRSRRATKSATSTTEPPTPAATAGAAAVAAAIAAATTTGEDRPGLESLLVEVCIRLPRRTPGASIDPHEERFLDEDEREANIAMLKRQKLLWRLRRGPLPVPLVVHEEAASTSRGPWSTVYRSTTARPPAHTARLVPVARIPGDLPIDLHPELPLTFPFDPFSALPPDRCEPTTGAPAGAEQPYQNAGSEIGDTDLPERIR